MKIKTLMRKIEEDAKKKNGKTSQVQRLEELTLLKYPYYLKQLRDAVQFPSKHQGCSSQKFLKILKFIQKYQRLQRAKVTLNLKSKARGITIPEFKGYYKVIVTKTA
jgi:hypothetical protein